MHELSPISDVDETPVHALVPPQLPVPTIVNEQDVSAPEASSPAAFVVSDGQETQALLDTYSFSAQRVASQDVSSPKGSSPAAFVVPAGQETQALLDTYSSSAQGIG